MFIGIFISYLIILFKFMIEGHQWKTLNLYKIKNISLPSSKLLVKEVEISNVTILIRNK